MSNYSFIDSGGEKRYLALHLRTMEPGDLRCCSGVVGAEGAPQLIPRSEWPKEGRSIQSAVQRILDQNGLNYCWDYGPCGAFEAYRHLAGFAHIDLSPVSLAPAANFRNEGLSLQEAAAQLKNVGLAPESIIKGRDYQGRDWPQDWKKYAAQYRAIRLWEAQYQQCFDALVSGIIQGQPVVLGTDAFGGGHCVWACAFGFDNGSWWAKGPNSWGLSYTNCNEPGYWKYSERHLTGLDNYGVYVIQAESVPDADVPPEPA